MMRDHEADPLVERMVNIWPSGPKASAWYDLFQTMDAALVGRVIDAARNTEQRISIARFAELCRDHAGAPRALPRCARCDTTGWVEAEPIIKQAPNGRHIVYSQVEPCVCPAGKQAEIARNRIEA